MIELRWNPANIFKHESCVEIDGRGYVLQYREYEYSVLSDGSDDGSGWGEWIDVEIADD